MLVCDPNSAFFGFMGIAAGAVFSSEACEPYSLRFGICLWNR